MLHVLTPSGGRPEALAMLAGYVNTQSYTGPLRWVICDDCDPASPVPPMRDGITVEVLRPQWRWKPGDNTQARSMLALLDRVPAGASVIVAEDDDAMLPAHVETMLAALQTAELVGERTARYYNIRTRRFRELRGTYHSSMAATALRGAALDRLREVCRTGKHLDMELWRSFTGPKRLLDTANVIGIKGGAGRGGIGVGHREEFGDPDPSGNVLRSWIGEHAEKYLS